MKLDCPLAPKCRYCGEDHDISSCTRMINEGQHRNRNGQANQVENSGNDNGSNNNNNGNNNNGNWNKNRNRRNFNQGGNFNYDQNNNYGNHNQLGNFNPNFNPNNFNNGGYNNNPNRYIPQVPIIKVGTRCFMGTLVKEHPHIEDRILGGLIIRGLRVV